MKNSVNFVIIKGIVMLKYIKNLYSARFMGKQVVLTTCKWVKTHCFPEKLIGYKNLKFFIAITLIIMFSANLFAKNPVRIKDIAIIDGLKDNQLMGFGLVTGLSGRGDSKSFKMTQKMLQNLALNHGFNIDQSELASKNIAAVLVTSTIGAFSRKGDAIDVTISSIGDAKSIEGGILLQTALKGADDNIYAVAQGRIIAGKTEQSTQLSATIPDGAIIENDIVSTFVNDSKIRIILKYPDFVTANQVKESVLGLNSNLLVNAVDAGMVEVTLGEDEKKNPVEFLSKLEVLTVTPDYPSSVVIDKKTGIIVVGEDIVIQDCSVTTPFAQVKVGTDKKKINFEIKGQTVGELVKILDEAGLKNDEIISMIEAIHKIGAINAKLIIL